MKNVVPVSMALANRIGSSRVTYFAWSVMLCSMVVFPTWRGPTTRTAPNIFESFSTVFSICL